MSSPARILLLMASFCMLVVIICTKKVTQKGYTTQIKSFDRSIHTLFQTNFLIDTLPQKHLLSNDYTYFPLSEGKLYNYTPAKAIIYQIARIKEYLGEDHSNTGDVFHARDLNKDSIILNESQSKKIWKSFFSSKKNFIRNRGEYFDSDIGIVFFDKLGRVNFTITLSFEHCRIETEPYIQYFKSNYFLNLSDEALVWVCADLLEFGVSMDFTEMSPLIGPSKARGRLIKELKARGLTPSEILLHLD